MMTLWSLMDVPQQHCCSENLCNKVSQGVKILSFSSGRAAAAIEESNEDSHTRAVTRGGSV